MLARPYEVWDTELAMPQHGAVKWFELPRLAQPLCVRLDQDAIIRAYFLCDPLAVMERRAIQCVANGGTFAHYSGAGLAEYATRYIGTVQLSGHSAAWHYFDITGAGLQASGRLGVLHDKAKHD